MVQGLSGEAIARGTGRRCKTDVDQREKRGFACWLACLLASFEMLLSLVECIRFALLRAKWLPPNLSSFGLYFTFLQDT